MWPFGWLKSALRNIQRQLASIESWLMAVCARLDRIERKLSPPDLEELKRQIAEMAAQADAVKTQLEKEK